MRRTTLAGACMAAIGTAYVRVVRPWARRWGATDDEVARGLPGDDIVDGHVYEATRAITIHAPPGDVWPWLVQMGSGRAGWYAYDALDNGRVPSATTIVPELQKLLVGDLVPMAVGKDVGPRVREIIPNHRMLWATNDEFTWAWLLEPAAAGGTRLVTRIRERYPPVFSRRMLYAIVASTGDIIMIRRQLLGIKARAEALARVRVGRAA